MAVTDVSDLAKTNVLGRCDNGYVGNGNNSWVWRDKLNRLRCHIRAVEAKRYGSRRISHYNLFGCLSCTTLITPQCNATSEGLSDTSLKRRSGAFMTDADIRL